MNSGWQHERRLYRYGNTTSRQDGRFRRSHVALKAPAPLFFHARPLDGGLDSLLSDPSEGAEAENPEINAAGRCSHLVSDFEVRVGLQGHVSNFGIEWTLVVRF